MSHKWSALASFDITDETGAVAFEARGDFGRSSTLYDPAGTVVATIMLNKYTGLHEIVANGAMVRLRRGGFGSVHPYQITSNRPGELTSTGTGEHLSLWRDGTVIAQMARQFSVRQKLTVDVTDGEHAAFALGIMLAMLAAHADR